MKRQEVIIAAIMSIVAAIIVGLFIGGIYDLTVSHPASVWRINRLTGTVWICDGASCTTVSEEKRSGK